MSVFAGRYAGRCAIVTGGASGLGKQVAARIIAEGGAVALGALGSAFFPDMSKQPANFINSPILSALICPPMNAC